MSEVAEEGGKSGHSECVLLVAASDVTAQHSGVEGGCLASALGWRGHVVDALIA